MATIKVQTVAVPMELEAQVTPEQIVQAFDSSIQELITKNTRQQVAEMLPSILQAPEYVRTARDWMMESFDYSYIAELVARHFSPRDIVEELIDAHEGSNPLESDHMIDRLARNSRVQAGIQRYTQEYLQASDAVSRSVNEMVERLTANLANEVAERVLTIISQRLNGGSDV